MLPFGSVSWQVNTSVVKSWHQYLTYLVKNDTCSWFCNTKQVFYLTKNELKHCSTCTQTFFWTQYRPNFSNHFSTTRNFFFWSAPCSFLGLFIVAVHKPSASTISSSPSIVCKSCFLDWFFLVKNICISISYLSWRRWEMDFRIWNLAIFILFVYLRAQSLFCACLLLRIEPSIFLEEPKSRLLLCVSFLYQMALTSQMLNASSRL